MDSIKILFATKELRNKLFISILLLSIFKILSHIPVPWTNTDLLVSISDESFFSFINAFSGGAIANFTIMATGVSAYISSQIIMQMLTYSSKKMHNLSKSPSGIKTIKTYTIALGIVIAFFSSIGTTIYMQNNFQLLINESWYVYFIIAIFHSIGTGIAIYLGEKITEKGFGNGMSLMIFINIITTIPNKLNVIFREIATDKVTYSMFFLTIIITIILFFAITLTESSEKRIPLLYVQAIARSGGSQKVKTYYPIKINLAGVMPVIISSYFFQIFTMLTYIKSDTVNYLYNVLDSNPYLYHIVFSIFIFLFSFVYSILIFDCKEIAETLQIRGGTIPGIRPGKPTADLLSKTKNNIVFINAFYLSITYMIPMIIMGYFGVTFLTASSIMILVGISLDTYKTIQVETDLRNHKKLY